MEAITTANQLFSYNQLFYGIPLDTWVQNAHKYNCEKNNWEYFPLRKGSFGYDNLAVSIGFTLSEYTQNQYTDPIPVMADLVHQGWVKNYLYWRDHSPQDSTPYRYTPPFIPLNDERRNTCAITPFLFLDNEEQEKDYIIAKFLYNEIQPIQKKG